MAFIPTANACRVSIEGAIGAVPVINTLWFTGASPFGTSEIDSLLTTLDYDWTTFMLPSLPNAYAVLGFTGYAQDSDTAPMGFKTPTSPGEGTHTTSALLNYGLCAAITLLTSARGRSGRGRNFVGPWREDQLSDANTLAATYVNNVLAAYGHIRTDCAALGFVLSVVSHVHNKVTLSAGVARPVTLFAMDGHLDYLRRRANE